MYDVVHKKVASVWISNSSRNHAFSLIRLSWIDPEWLLGRKITYRSIMLLCFSNMSHCCKKKKKIKVFKGRAVEEGNPPSDVKGERKKEKGCGCCNPWSPPYSLTLSHYFWNCRRQFTKSYVLLGDRLHILLLNMCEKTGESWRQLCASASQSEHSGWSDLWHLWVFVTTEKIHLTKLMREC